jgi:glutaminyl-peptide cyclotransferase
MEQVRRLPVLLRPLLATWLMSVAAGCGGGGPSAVHQPSPPDRFDAPAAFMRIREQVAAGQRPAGSPQLRRLAERLRRELPDGRFEAVRGQPGLRNIVGTVPGSEPELVVGAHYDTLVKPRGFVGANNGAAGSAIVIELARELAARKRPPGAPAVRFVLFDGEEPATGLPEESTDFLHQGLRGSRDYVRRHARRTGAMVLLDYVAGKGLQLPMEASSNPELWAQIRAAARRTGHLATFPDRTGVAIDDDHTPFLEDGIPAVDMIDWSYPGHSLKDGIDLLSPRSVDAVGETVTALIEYWH